MLEAMGQELVNFHVGVVSLSAEIQRDLRDQDNRLRTAAVDKAAKATLWELRECKQ